MAPRRQQLCTEPLERRWLFSAPADGPRLPPEVVDSIEATFPGAEILQTESSVEEGRREYDVTAEIGGRIVDATFAADGKLLESEVLRARPVEPPPAEPPMVADTVPPPAPVDAVEVVEVVPVEEVDNDVVLAPTELPPGVAAAMGRLFPGARLIEAESDDEAGTPEVGVIAEFDGGVIDVSFAPDGKLIESQVPLDPAALPPAALEWVRRNYPGALIEDAQAVTKGGRLTYELTVVPPGGEAVEVSLNVAPLRGAAADEFVPVAAKAAADVAAVAAVPELTDLRRDVPPRAPATADATPEAGSVAAPQTEVYAAEAAPPSPEAMPAETDPATADERSVTAQQRLRTATSPRQAPSIGTVLVAQLADLERRLAAVLRGLDLLAAQTGLAGAVDGSAVRAAAVVALLAAAQVLLVDSRKTRPGRVKIFRGDPP